MVLLPIDYLNEVYLYHGFCLCICYVWIFYICFFSKKRIFHILNIFANILWDTKYFMNLHYFNISL